MSQTVIVSPSILAADPAHLEQEIRKMEKAGASFIHLDVMDGHFVPAKTFDDSLIRKLRPCSKIVFDVHLMVQDPLRVIPSYCLAGADYVTFHVEACKNLLEARQCIDLIHSFSKQAGIAVKPHTPVEEVFPLWNDLDLLLVMSVEPGKGGQKFLPIALNKLSLAKKQNEKAHCEVLLNVDGGINAETGEACKKAGASVLVAGSYLYGHDDYMERLKGLLQ